VRVLIACEYSGRVRDEFIKLGHDAMSCDLLPTDAPGPHYQGDVRDVLDYPWDMMIAHPPCTDLAVSGAAWFAKKRIDRKSRRLNSSHLGISYAVFCLKKKKTHRYTMKNRRTAHIPLTIQRGERHSHHNNL